jgi:hypothetical protein
MPSAEPTVRVGGYRRRVRFVDPPIVATEVVELRLPTASGDDGDGYDPQQVDALLGRCLRTLIAHEGAPATDSRSVAHWRSLAADPDADASTRALADVALAAVDGRGDGSGLTAAELEGVRLADAQPGPGYDRPAVDDALASIHATLLAYEGR